MSEFDKEAEREKLRKQFAEDDRKRASTERMSELLLKGATMTNKHCDACGDPIFRWQDEEFCPTCTAEGQERAAGERAAQGRTEEQRAAEEATPPRPAEADGDPTAVESPPSGETVDVGEIDVEPPERSGSPEPPEPPESPESPEPSATTRSVRDPPSGPQESAASQRTPGAPNAEAGASPGRYADLSAARESLARTVTRFAEEAEAADDLARAREFLAAVGDAADALAAVRRAERR
ncbi:Sjogren's syndrome/scleroderma autoantigen 1 family protein [Halomarina pelagica]|uniref:Sjogren's syndrome/scleroderma autoantigen 1 family protein n=1 Tax=Halomarina pelagica TaxID=2961599 RepID=UPI0020C1D9F8|nr:Sjogren's syndrome/scleroderma autoantigen 1 family protein [Halomarina sp. BND7]